MDGLYQFLAFDWDKFSCGKVFEIKSVRKWFDFNDKSKELGTNVEVIIVQDDTEYKTKDGTTITNLYEKFSFKLEKPISEVKFVPGELVEPVNPRATIYGKYRDSLSVRVDDLITSPKL